MHRGFQLSFLATGQGKGYLFGAGVLQKYLDQHKFTPIPEEAQRARVIGEWLESLRQTTASESTLEPEFINQIMCAVLGYVLYPAPTRAKATIYPKPGSKITGIEGRPDASLGEFSESGERFVAAVELKTPGTDLDLPQPGYGYRSPAEQGLAYGKNILGVHWVVVSDMRVIRLYSVEIEDAYEEIDLADCVDSRGLPTATFRKLIFLLHHNYLIKGFENSQVSALYGKSAQRQIAIRDNFYEVYYAVRADLYEAVRSASNRLNPLPDQQELLEATQRLLDRLLFIYYCEDHPQHLIDNGTLQKVVQAARSLPGDSSTRVYEYLKALFREIDSGSPATSGLRVPGYNGELFKRHRIIDTIELPDSLDDNRYEVRGPDGKRIIRGVWGLHVYDFWSELNEYLLGHIFEESLSDLEEFAVGAQALTADKVRQRKAGGVFFTSSILADFLCGSAVKATLDETAPLHGESVEQVAVALQNRVEHLLTLRAVDFACGSGAFLTSLYRELLQEFWRLQSSLASIRAENNKGDVDLLTAASVVDQARRLPSCVFGVDKLPQAVEIAKLAVWLRSAQKGEKVLDLSSNIVPADSLDLPGTFTRLGQAPGAFDLVVGNPPWGGEIQPSVYEQAVEYLGLSQGEKWDSWELFFMLSLRALREGGRLALVLPDSFFYPEKARTRRLLFDCASVEKVHYLGPGWFGPRVRMGALAIQARRGPIHWAKNILCMLLAGGLRLRAIAGELPLTQIECQRSRLIPTDRVVNSATRELEVFRGLEDDRIINVIETHGSKFSSENGLCERARGEEINKSGLIWICPSCLNPTTPGAKKKGGGYEDKQCSACGHPLTQATVESDTLVSRIRPKGECVAFIDGDDINRRYGRVRPAKWLRLDLSGWSYKDRALYRSPKILVRQAGVAVCATLDETDSWCPQSVYVYRLRQDRTAEGYQHEFVLGALLSRTVAFVVFKRFGEVDPAKAHAKLTHERLADLPIPVVDFHVPSQRKAHGRIVRNVRKLLDGTARLGEAEDREIEQLLRSLWGLKSTEGAYINGEFYDLPDSQPLRDLFPNERPRPLSPRVLS